MPVLNIRTNEHIDDKDALMREASKRMAVALDKPEGYVMVMVEDDARMLFAGSPEPLAYLELKSLGLGDDRTAELSATLCGFIHEQLGIDASRVYIEFAAPERTMFGWNSGTF